MIKFETTIKSDELTVEQKIEIIKKSFVDKKVIDEEIKSYEEYCKNDCGEWAPFCNKCDVFGVIAVLKVRRKEIEEKK